MMNVPKLPIANGTQQTDEFWVELRPGMGFEHNQWALINGTKMGFYSAVGSLSVGWMAYMREVLDKRMGVVLNDADAP